MQESHVRLIIWWHNQQLPGAVTEGSSRRLANLNVFATGCGILSWNLSCKLLVTAFIR